MAGAREGRGIRSRIVMVREGRETGFLGMLGQIRGAPRWADDPVVAVSEAGERRLWGRRDIGRNEERVGRFQ